MPNDISPICKALIALLAGASTPMSLADIRNSIPHGDPDAIAGELQMLVEATIVHRQRERYRAFSYWLVGSDATPTSSFADVAEASAAHVFFAGGNADCLAADSGNRRWMQFTSLPSAPDILSRAAQHMADRAATYDKPEGERSMGATVAAFNAVTGRDLAEAEGWLLLQLLKDVRLFQRPGYHADSAEDAVAYTALMGEAKARDAAAAAGDRDA
jgi:hypothetical protein